MPSPIPIVYDVSAISEGLKKLEQERAQKFFTLPTGVRIVARFGPETLLPDDCEMLFLLRESTRRLQLRRCTYPSHRVVPAVREFCAYLAQYYPSAIMLEMHEIQLTTVDYWAFLQVLTKRSN